MTNHQHIRFTITEQASLQWMARDLQAACGMPIELHTDAEDGDEWALFSALTSGGMEPLLSVQLTDEAGQRFALLDGTEVVGRGTDLVPAALPILRRQADFVMTEAWA